MFDRAVTGVLNKCTLLYFTYADFEEQNMKFEKVHKIYQDFLEVQEIDPTLCYVQYMKFCRRAEGIKVDNDKVIFTPIFFVFSLREMCSRRQEKMNDRTFTSM